MKKKKLVILFSVLAAVLVIGTFAYLYFFAAWPKEAFYSMIDTSDTDKMARLYLPPTQIELSHSPRQGDTVHFQNYSLTVSGQENVVIDEDLNDDNISLYHVGDIKLISLHDMSWAKHDYIIDDPSFLSLVEKAAGHKISNEFEYFDASFSCSPDYFTLFDINKNKGVSIMLDLKFHDMMDGCYQFDNGVVKGFICAIEPEVSWANVLFTNCDNPDSYYGINFVLFSLDEIKEILGTIKFDDTAQTE